MAENALALNDSFYEKINKTAMNSIKTSGAEIKRKRIELAKIGAQADEFGSRALECAVVSEEEYSAARSRPDFEAYAATHITQRMKEDCISICTLFNMSGLRKGIELVVDSITSEEVVEMEGKKARRRITMAEMVRDMVVSMSPDDPDDFESFSDLLSDLREMLNDIGCQKKAFLDDNGVHNDGKYLSTTVAEPDKVTQVAAGEAVTEEEEEEEMRKARKETKHGK